VTVIEVNEFMARSVVGRTEYRDVLVQHRALLRTFAAGHHDALADELLADDVGSRPFPTSSRSE
jgi:hypothetical protein